MVEDVRRVGIGFGQLGAFRNDGAAGEVALDVLDDDDGVVDDEAGGQRDAEEGQGVDAEAEDLDEGEGADERDRDGDGWNDGSAPVLQEEKDDDDDDDDGLADGADDLVDRLADNESGVDGDDALKAGGIVFLELGEDGAATFIDVEGVGVGELQDADADGIATLEALAGEFQAGVVVLSTNLGATYVFDQNDSAAVGAVLDDDVLELLWVR